jgi:hypothetical protein
LLIFFFCRGFGVFLFLPFDFVVSLSPASIANNSSIGSSPGHLPQTSFSLPALGARFPGSTSSSGSAGLMEFGFFFRGKIHLAFS